LTAPHVLVAAFSGRALAASARRAGFVPHVVDCFGDLDLEAATSRCLPARVQTGFRPRALLAALEDLAACAERPPLGLVLGTGFECDPRLLVRLAERFRLLGCAPEVVRGAKDPATLFPLLDRVGIAHPETRREAPARPDGWLMKRVGGSGGLHVLACPSAPRPDPRRYFQRRLEGTPVSVAAVVAGRTIQICGFTEQWCSPLPRRRYRYGGAVTQPDISPSAHARMIAAAEALAPALGLTGLVSFDFLLAGDTPYLLEVNPRPGATLDILDDGHGALFQAHVAAALGDPLAPEPDRSSRARAGAFLYADDGPLTVPALRWPGWSADRPRPGTLVGAHQPLATAFAEADTAAAARAACTQRLGELRDLLYADQKIGKETLT
jgi:predicted ATP-grasp superfamily ATP-dependent carboligase